MPISPDVAAQLRSLRDDWSDEIPPQIVHSNNPAYKHHKVRMAFFEALISTPEVGVIDRTITPPSH